MGVAAAAELVAALAFSGDRWRAQLLAKGFLQACLQELHKCSSRHPSQRAETTFGHRTSIVVATMMHSTRNVLLPNPSSARSPLWTLS